MKIIDKKNDYFDNVAYSEEPLWIRKVSTMILPYGNILSKSECKRNEFGLTNDQLSFLVDSYKSVPWFHSFHSRENIRSIERYVLGYCGSLYPFFTYFITEGEKTIRKSYFDINDFISKVNTNRNKKDKIKIQKGSTRSYFSKRYVFNNENIKNWKTEFDNPNILTDIFIKIKSPIFIIDGDGKSLDLVINPHMKSYGMVSCIDPYTAYQDIERYIGNELAMCSQIIPDFGDELKRDAHGMDEWSFKNKTCPKKRKQKK